MKNHSTPRKLSRFGSYIRFGFAFSLVLAAAAMAFVATQPSVPLLFGKSEKKPDPNKLIQLRARYLRNKLALPGAERDGGPTAAAEQDYANRAYPAPYVPIRATLNARAAFQTVRARGNSNIGVWNLIGPSTTNFPDVLTFSGAPYVTSGRITALAISPS